jgi:hypothetical protein
VVGAATVTAVFAGTGSYLTPAGFVHGLRPAMIALAILAALGAAAGHAVRHPATTRQPPTLAIRTGTRADRCCRPIPRAAKDDR